MKRSELFELSDDVYYIRHKINDIDSMIESKQESIEILKEILEDPTEARLEVNGSKGHVSAFIEKEVFVREAVEFTLQMVEKVLVDLQNQRTELDNELTHMAERLNEKR